VGQRKRVALFGEQRRNITVEEGATEGAVVGSNLVWSDGTTVTEADIRNSSSTTTNTNIQGNVWTGVTIWSLITGIPAIIKSLAALATNGWIRNDSGVISALHWPYVKPAVDAGESFTLPAGEQLLVYESFDVAGTFTLNGELVILGADKDSGMVRDSVVGDMDVLVPEDHQYIVFQEFTFDGGNLTIDGELVILGGDIDGPVKTAFASKGIDYTLTDADHVVKATAAGLTFTMMTAVGREGAEFIVKNHSTGELIVDGDGTETIDGGLTATLADPYESITVISDGSNWNIV
jgi:hypothetical protein